MIYQKCTKEGFDRFPSGFILTRHILQYNDLVYIAARWETSTKVNLNVNMILSPTMPTVCLELNSDIFLSGRVTLSMKLLF